MRRILDLIKDESGQDLIEYTLLLAFVALFSVALFRSSGLSIQGVWSSINAWLARAQ